MKTLLPIACSLTHPLITDPFIFARSFVVAAGWRESDIPHVQAIAETGACRDSELHGMRHWLQVLVNGNAIAEATPELHSNALRETMRLFALFHDVRRIHDGACNEHGKAAAMYLVHGLPKDLAYWVEDRFGPEIRDYAAFACECHTIVDVPSQSIILRQGVGDSPLGGRLSRTECLLIGACLDADRLDLGRVGIEPHPHYLTTDAAKAHAVEAMSQRPPLRNR